MYRVVIGFIFIVVLCPQPSQADAGDQYLLPKIGTMSVELNEADSLSSVGLLYGYGITPEFTLEGELNAGLSGGEYKRTLNSGTRLEGKYTVWTIAGYGVYRYPVTDNIFLKGKLGLLYENIDRDGIQTTSGDLARSDDNKSKGLGFAGGLGFGFRAKSTIFEIEGTLIDSDILFYSLGVNYAF